MNHARNLVVVVLFATSMMLGAAGTMLAQSISGSLDGVVKDPQGATVASAEITISHTGTGYTRSMKSNDNGAFRFDDLNVGDYDVKVTAPGFKQYVTKVPVGLGANAIAPALAIGGVTESVTVSAGAAMIDASTAEIGRSITSPTMEALPVLNRNPADFLQLEPGVPAYPQDKNGTFTVGGQRPRETTYNVDGASNNFEVSSGPRTPVILEAVAEMHAVTAVFSPQFGKGSGAVIDMVMKSGGNQYHGSLLETLRNTDLNANSYFSNATGVAKAPYNLNVYSATLGGPVKKNRTFFFLAFQGTDQRSQGIERLTVASNANRTILTNNALFQSGNPTVAATINGAFARLPSCVATTESCIYTSNQVSNLDEFIGSAKVDHRFTDNDLVSFRFLKRDYEGVASTAIASANQTSSNRDDNLAVTYHRIFGPTMVNELTFARSGFSRAVLVPDPGLPDIQISGYSSIGSGSNLPQQFSNTYYQVIDTFSMAKGKHYLKFGGDFLDTDTVGFAYFQGRGIYQFASLPAQYGSTDALADFRLGLASAYAQDTGDFARDFRNPDMSLYVQDDWKLRPNLTLNLGLRYEIQFPPTVIATTSGQVAYEAFDPVKFQFAHWNSNLGDFSPFVGFAWDPTGSGRTSVRGGYRRAYDRLVQDFYNIGSILQAPFVTGLGLSLPQVPVIPAGNAQSIAKNAGVPVSTMLDPGIKMPYADSWHLSVQRRFGSNAVLEVGYLGTAGRNLPEALASNRVDPTTKARPNAAYGQIVTVNSTAISNYNGLLAKFSYHLGSRLNLTASYTYSKAMDNVEDAVASYGGESSLGTVATMPGPVPGTQLPVTSLEYAPAIFDRRQVFSSGMVYRTPNWIKNPFAGLLLNGWNASTIVFVQSGAPFTVLAGVDLNQDGLNNDRPDLVNGSLLGDLHYSNPSEVIPKAAFTAVATPAHIGNFGRNVLTRDGIVNTDLSAVKSFPVWGERHIEFRGEFFNLFNHVRFGAPVSTLSSATFGQIQSQENSPRFIRFSLKFKF